MNLSKNHQIPLSKIYICLCQKKHIYPYQKFAFTFIFFLHFILTGTKGNIMSFIEKNLENTVNYYNAKKLPNFKVLNDNNKYI